MMRRRGWTLLLAMAVAAGCGGDGEPAADSSGEESGDAAAETAAPPPSGIATEFAGSLDVELSAMNEAGSGLWWRTLEEGDGATVEPGDTAVVHYTGWLPDGTKFDSSRDRGEPFSFAVGQGRVIRGWDEGVAGMRAGEVRQLVIPPDLGYGERGAGDVIPPNATLVFEVELLEVRESGGG